MQWTSAITQRDKGLPGREKLCIMPSHAKDIKDPIATAARMHVRPIGAGAIAILAPELQAAENLNTTRHVCRQAPSVAGVAAAAAPAWGVPSATDEGVVATELPAGAAAASSAAAGGPAVAVARVGAAAAAEALSPDLARAARARAAAASGSQSGRSAVLRSDASSCSMAAATVSTLVVSRTCMHDGNFLQPGIVPYLVS